MAQNAQKKLQKKNADLIIANNLRQEGGVFGKDTNQVTIYNRNGQIKELPVLSKEAVADEILNQVKILLKN